METTCVESCMSATVRECACACRGRNHALHSIERLDGPEARPERDEWKLEADDE